MDFGSQTTKTDIRLTFTPSCDILLVKSEKLFIHGNNLQERLTVAESVAIFDRCWESECLSGKESIYIKAFL